MKRLVVVDDDPDFSLLVRELLRGEGFEVIRCDDEAAAVECVLEHRPHLVLLDIRMREPLSGLRVLEGIRSHPDIADTPILVCTAALTEKLKPLLPSDQVSVLAKPFDLEEFLAIVKRLTDGNGGARGSRAS